MKNLILFFCILLFSFQAIAKNAELEKARKAAGECERSFKKLDQDDKFQCMMKVTYYLELQDKVLQKQILDLQLITTGY